jgi:hypothetical protein
MKRILFPVFLLLTATPALAVDFGAHIRSIDGKDIPVSNIDESPVTLGKISEDALIATLPNDNPTPDEKSRRFFLAMKVHAGKDPSAEEVMLLKKVIGMAYGPLVVGRATELLDPASVPK